MPILNAALLSVILRRAMRTQSSKGSDSFLATRSNSACLSFVAHERRFGISRRRGDVEALDMQAHGLGRWFGSDPLAQLLPHDFPPSFLIAPGFRALCSSRHGLAGHGTRTFSNSQLVACLDLVRSLFDGSCDYLPSMTWEKFGQREAEGIMLH